MIRALFRRFVQPLFWWAYRNYSRKKRWHTYDGLRICLYPSVFHPVWMLTTTTLLDYVKQLNITQKNVLELGAGNGLVALSCVGIGANVTASDLNSAAIRSIEESAVTNQLELKIIHSDLFKSIPPQQFDYIFINPPYFPQAPSNDQEMAFFCGTDFEYFQQLFMQMPAYVYSDSTVLMILTDDCDLNRIETIAQSHYWNWQLVKKRKKWGECHLIYSLSFRKLD